MAPPSSSPPAPVAANAAGLPLIVQKYGGTSVGTAERMLDVAKIVRSNSQHSRVIVVLSAMSSYKKSEGTTSRLLEAATEVLKPNSDLYLSIVDAIENDHVRAVKACISDPTLLESVVKDVKFECQKLRSFMAAAEIIDEISPRSRDVIISAGEKLSARIFSAVLQSQGVNAVYINLEKLIDKTFDNRTIDQSFYDYLAQRLSVVLPQLAPSVTSPNPTSQPVVPVVTGYFGPVPGSILSTIGRGYTDLTAALIAVALRASELQIWKEVDGIFTADPRKAPKARLLPYISPEEAAELTYYGSEVIHPFTMEQVIRARIPIRIKNAFKPDGRGTVILPEGYREEELLGGLGTPTSPSPTTGTNLTETNEKDGEAIISRSRHPTAVTIKDNVTVLNVHSNKKSVSHGFFAHIFQTLDKYGIVVDLISTSEVHVSMALNPTIQQDKLDQALVELRKNGTVDVIPDMAILSLVGKQMRNMVGIASKMFSTLARHRVNIEMISQGASEINISCVIEEKGASVALRAVHDECIVGVAAEVEPEGTTS